MTKAEQAKESWQHKGSVIKATRNVDQNVEVDHDAGMTFYRFSDGSVLGTKGRARSHQMWII